MNFTSGKHQVFENMMKQKPEASRPYKARTQKNWLDIILQKHTNPKPENMEVFPLKKR